MRHNNRHNKSQDTKTILSPSVYTLRSLPLPYLYVNSVGVVLFANVHFTRLVGYSLVEIVQLSIDNLFVSPLAEHLPLLSRGIDFHPDGIHICIKHKQEHTLSSRIKVLVDDNDDLAASGYHIIFIQESANYEADDRVKHLEEDHAELQKRFKAQTDFVNNYLFELRSPVSILSTSLYLLNKSSEDAKHRYAEQLGQQIEHLTEMIAAATAYMQTEIVDNAINGKVLSLNHLVQEATNIFQHQFEKSELQYRVKVLSRECTIIGNKARLLKAFINIIENAIQYTPDGSISVGMQADYDRSLVFVHIQDTGIGIPEAEVSHIFDRFYRAENAKQHREKGTGLGLCITKHIVEQHNGEIAVFSQEDGGTSVIVTLPLVY